MSQHTINVTGITSGITPQAGPPPRRPIFDVVKDPKTFSLLIQGLGSFLIAPLSMQRTPDSVLQLRCNKQTRTKRLLTSSLEASMASRTSSGMAPEDLNRSLTNGEAIAIMALSRSPLGIVLMSLCLRCDNVLTFPFCYTEYLNLPFAFFSKSFKRTLSASPTNIQLPIRFNGKTQQPNSGCPTGTGPLIRCLRTKLSNNRTLMSLSRTAQRRPSRILSMLIRSIPSQTASSIHLGINGERLYDAPLMTLLLHKPTSRSSSGEAATHVRRPTVLT